MTTRHEELLDVLDEAGRVTGQAPRSRCHGRPDLIHPVVHVLVEDADGRLFLQKRAPDREVQPGKWDTSVGGHLGAGEEPGEGARRELLEELGVDGGRLEFLYSYLWRCDYESEWVHTFRCRHQGPFRLQEEEISSGRFWTRDEINQQRGTGIFTPNFLHEFDLFCAWKQRGEA